MGTETQPSLDGKHQILVKPVRHEKLTIRDSVIFADAGLSIKQRQYGDKLYFYLSKRIDALKSQLQEEEWKSKDRNQILNSTAIILRNLIFIIETKINNLSKTDDEIANIIRTSYINEVIRSGKDLSVSSFYVNSIKSNYITDFFSKFLTSEDEKKLFETDFISKKSSTIHDKILIILHKCSIVAPDNDLYKKYKDLRRDKSIDDLLKIYEEISSLRNVVHSREMDHIHKARAEVVHKKRLRTNSTNTFRARNGNDAYQTILPQLSQMDEAQCFVDNIYGEKIEIFRVWADLNNDLGQNFSNGWLPQKQAETSDWYTRMKRGF